MLNRSLIFYEKADLETHINHVHKNTVENIPIQPNTEDDVIVPVEISSDQGIKHY